jgi:hypothetical protein
MSGGSHATYRLQTILNMNKKFIKTVLLKLTSWCMTNKEKADHAKIRLYKTIQLYKNKLMNKQ